MRWLDAPPTGRLTCEKRPPHLAAGTCNHDPRHHNYESGTPVCATRYAPVSPVAWLMPADTEARTGAQRVTRTVLALIAVTVMVSTGVAWGKIRSFENGIFHISTSALGGGGQDGAIDILLVGMDSRTDAHGNPLSADELATLHAGDDVSTNTDTIILVRIPQQREVGDGDLDPPATPMSRRRTGQDEKINGVYGQVKLEKMKQLVEQQGLDPAEAEPKAVEAGREALIKTVADLTGGHRRPLCRDRPTWFLTDHRCARRCQCVPERCRLRTTLRCRLPGRLAETQRTAGTEFRPAASRPPPAVTSTAWCANRL